MTLKDIKKMSNEEFISYVNRYRNTREQTSLEEDFKANNELINIGSIISGITFGFVPTSVLDNFTDDAIKLGIVFSIGTIIGIPVAKRLIKWMYAKTKNLASDLDKQELIELKKDLENISDEQLLFLKGINNNQNIYELHRTITEVFSDNNPNEFIDSLEVTYKDDKEELGYSKNISKNN